MKKNLLVLILLTLLASPLFSEAIVLPIGTTLTIPNQESFTIDSVRFLLERSDMEIAALALETIPIKDDQIKKLTQAYNEIAALAVFVLAVVPFLSIFVMKVLL